MIENVHYRQDLSVQFYAPNARFPCGVCVEAGCVVRPVYSNFARSVTCPECKDVAEADYVIDSVKAGRTETHPDSEPSMSAEGDD